MWVESSAPPLHLNSKCHFHSVVKVCSKDRNCLFVCGRVNSFTERPWRRNWKTPPDGNRRHWRADPLGTELERQTGLPDWEDREGGDFILINTDPLHVNNNNNLREKSKSKFSSEIKCYNNVQLKFQSVCTFTLFVLWQLFSKYLKQM